MNILIKGILGTFLSIIIVSCEPEKSNIYISDIENFWEAYDSINQIENVNKQIRVMKNIYINNGTEGLKSFMKLRNFNELDLIESINKYPKFWSSIRPNTLKVNNERNELNEFISRFKNLYSNYREADIYFCITAVRSGGTTKGSQVLIGTEIATGNFKTDVSEFPNKRLETFFKTQSVDNIIPFTIHEYVHTQQNTEGKNLLGQSIYEGSCDFITELVLKKELEHAYLLYGKENETELKKQFRQDMYSDDYSDWLYNGNNTKNVGDLGYFMGYAICKSFYHQADDKAQAISRIIELNYDSENELKEFLEQSKYFN